MKDRQQIMREAAALVRQLTTIEKAHLLSGADDWHMAGVERLGIRPVTMSDGPNGMRTTQFEGDHIGEAVKSTCFPSLSTLACSFDPELAGEIGGAIADECRKQGVKMLLGPGVNIKRSPLCGRNFEYLSEDPLLAGKVAAGLIRGVQAKGVTTTVKHFACNNQEKDRMVSDSVVDERALHEIYLKPFEIAIREGGAANVMCSYNKLNGVYASDSRRLLTELLRNEMGFDGLVVSDWGAMGDWIGSVEAGLDLAMPGKGLEKREKMLCDAIKKGKLSEEALNKAAERVLVDLLLADQVEEADFEAEEHHQLVRKAAGECAVLLENKGLLPLKQGQKLAVIGPFAKKPRFQGAGSSQITPLKVTSLCEVLDQRAVDYVWAPGIGSSEKIVDKDKIAEALALSKDADVTVVLAGLPDSFESESGDRPNILLPVGYLELIDELVKSGKPVAVLLVSGSVVSLPFGKDVDALLYCGLTGQNNGEALFDLLYGEVNPSGRLAETWPFEEDCQPIHAFGKREVPYRESIYVGYRFYDKAKKDVAYPFGYGLSYTEFLYSNLHLSGDSLRDGAELTVSVTVTNTGNRAGKEVVQIYVEAPETTLFKPARELKGFAKVFLAPGESKEVSISLPASAFTYYNIPAGRWHCECGSYRVLVCKNSREVLMEASVEIKGDESIAVPDYRETAPDYYRIAENPVVGAASFAAVYGRALPMSVPARPFHLNSTLGDILQAGWLAKLYKKIEPKLMESLLSMGGVSEEGAESLDMEAAKTMMDNVLMGLPLRNLVNLSNGALSLGAVKGLIKFLNLTTRKE